MQRVGLVLELVDFLTFKCTGSLDRYTFFSVFTICDSFCLQFLFFSLFSFNLLCSSLNAITSNLLYQPPPTGTGWNEAFYKAIGLEVLLENDCFRLGSN